MIPPLLEFMATGVGSGQIFEQKTEELYACDAGVEDAIWQIKYEGLPTMFPSYDEYDYANSWSYNLAENVNDEGVAVDIQNVWVPKDITPLDPDEMQAIIDGTDEAGCRIRVNGSSTVSSQYRIRIDIIPEHDEWDLRVESIGVWLPSGFSYVDDSSNLEYWGISDPVVYDYAGGEAVIWSFGLLPFAELPPTGRQEAAIVEFEYTSETTREMVTVSWIDTQNLGGGVQIPFSWDDDTKVFNVLSASSSGTTVESNVFMNSSYSSFLNNAITTPGATDIQPNTTVNGIIECPLDGFTDEPAAGDWEWQDYDEEWPDTEEWTNWFFNHVNDSGPTDPGASVDLKFYDDDDDYIGRWYHPGDLDIVNSQSGLDTMILEGPIYAAGDLDFKQPGGGGKEYTINMNYQTIFAEGEITFPSEKITLEGSGCIIAVGDVFFHPNISSANIGFIFVCSLTENVDFNPGGTFYGSVAGQNVVGMQPGSTITWTSPPGGLNLPGMGGGSTGGFGINVTKYTWKID